MAGVVPAIHVFHPLALILRIRPEIKTLVPRFYGLAIDRPGKKHEGTSSIRRDTA
jgi:hypothetical protein